MANDIKKLAEIERGYERWKRYNNSWKTVDLDELVDRLFKEPVYENDGQKFIISAPNSKYIIYCDNSGSYFRIGNKEIPKNHKGHFLGINLESVLNEKVNGKTIGTSKKRREELSHFKMLIKKGVK